MLGLFRNTLTADHIHSSRQMKKLQQPVPLPLSQERKTFSGIFLAFSKSAQNSVHF